MRGGDVVVRWPDAFRVAACGVAEGAALPMLTHDPFQSSALGRERCVSNVGQLLEQEAKAVDERADDCYDDPENVIGHHARSRRLSANRSPARTSDFWSVTVGF